MKVPFVDLQAQQAQVEDRLNEVIHKIIKQAHFVLGPEVGQFESEFANYCGTQYAVGVDCGLSALELALRAYEIGPGAEVILPANTFIATAGAVTFAGARPVLVDVSPETYNIDPIKLEAAITPQTKAIIPVHLFGAPVDMEQIMNIANRHGLIVIEDACQAHGARFKGRRVGSFGHAAAFSFYPAKNLGAAGDAGIVTTNDAQAAEKIRAMRNCGQREKYYHTAAPFNHRLDTLQAAVLSVKLPHLDNWNAARRQHAALYNELLQDCDLVLPTTPDTIEPVWHLYVVRTNLRDELKGQLDKFGIGTGIHYPVPIHLQPYYQNLGYRKGDFPITEQLADQILSLPMFPELTREAIEYVADAINQFSPPRKTATAAASTSPTLVSR